ncbi:hypothetical protein [Domibacillus tundrae]|uniref:hypothetical protein n=1 Tax=Domibacillus tundrae TaxID=1587527 RepID=UPI0033982349
MKKMLPAFFILLGIGCMTLSSTAFHTRYLGHYRMESLLCICLFLIVPVLPAFLFKRFSKKTKKE